MEKKIIAALELADHEVRLIVGQFDNGRLNILKVERVAHKGIENFKIKNSSSIREAILKSIANASKNIGSQITSVLMLLPGVDLQVKQDLQTIMIHQSVKQEDLNRVYGMFLNQQVLGEDILVNVLVNRFHINGIASRKIPLDEKCHTMSVEASLYYCNKDIVFDYVKIVESTGLEIIDVVIDDIAYAKEASLLEKSIDRPIIAVDLERNVSKMTLFNKGQLLSNVYTDANFKLVFDKMHHLYGFDDDIIERLIYYNLDVNEVAPSKDPIFAWSTKSKDHTLSKYDVYDYVGVDIMKILNNLYETALPIFEYGDAQFVLSGEASLTAGLKDVLENISGKSVTLYRPNTFGIKNPCFTSLVGALYYYKDLEYYREGTKGSIDEKEFYAKMIYREIENAEQSKSSTANFTKKLKDLFVE